MVDSYNVSYVDKAQRGEIPNLQLYLVAFQLMQMTHIIHSV